MNSNLPESASSMSSRKNRREQKLRRKRRTWRNLALGFLLSLFVLAGAAVTIGFATPWGKSVRLTLAETIISTRHVNLAHYITTPSEFAALMKQLYAPAVGTGVPTYVHVSTQAEAEKVEIHEIAQQGWNGYVMLVHDPKLVRLVPAQVHKGMGEYVTGMAERTGAVAGTNASGFEDPKGEGWGGEAVGLVMSDGRVTHWPKGTQGWATVGFTNQGIMVMGSYSVAELQRMGVRDAMQFHPELVVNGQPMITYGDGGWGYGPRTAVGQAKDGTVIFIVINGRYKGGSGMGASQRQVMDLMLQYGAVNACAMDGGSSSVLYGKGQILNSPSTLDPNHERHLPDAWLVYPSDQAANQVSGVSGA